MSAKRLNCGGDIDLGRKIRFTFDGKVVEAFEGDTFASALLAADRKIVARSFKYRRPRGIFGAGVEEPNAYADLRKGDDLRLNLRLTTEAAVDGAVLKSASTSPSAEHDRTGIIDRFARFIPSGFYYKTFIWPNWHAFERPIREMAGLGRVDPSKTGPEGEQKNHVCDVVVVGAGPVGIAAALMLAESGKSVLLCDDGSRMGGSLLARDIEIDGLSGQVWLEQSMARLRALGVQLLPMTTAFGIYDHGLIALNQRRSGRPDLLWRVRPAQIVLATGAIDRPLPFAMNDLPGVMSAQAAQSYLTRYGVLVGEKIVLASNNSSTQTIALALAQAGAQVTLVDYAADAPEIQAPNLQQIRGARLEAALGKRAVTGVKLSTGQELDCDCVLVSGGFSPTIHLYAQAKGKLRFDDKTLALVPELALAGVTLVGAAKGDFTLSEAFVGLAAALALPAPRVAEECYHIIPAWPDPDMKGRVWIDYQHDVTTKDVALAERENFVSVEHLKRYTTLGMATDQGKTSNLNGLSLMAQLTGRTIPEVGTTTYRPPFTPVPYVSLAGPRGGERMNPLRRLALEDRHRALQGKMGEYGGWLRPAYYGADESAIMAEAKVARDTVGLFDATPLGKIEVIGPDAAEFLDFIYYNTVSTLKPGGCRYGFILSESGIVYDDGVLVRLEDNRYIVSCSSSHVAGVHGMLEEWRQDRFPEKQIFIHNATAETATITVTGPLSRQVIEAAGIEADLSDDGFKHMTTLWGRFGGEELRLTRVSFTGDRSYELSIRRDLAGDLWDRLQAAAAPLGGRPVGIEAIMILRAEKGFIVIGKDSDGMTRPMDLGLAGPLKNKKVEFIGRRSLLQEEAQREDRNQLVGLVPADGLGLLPIGAHGIDLTGGSPRSIGYVTTSHESVSLSHPVALGLIERGASRHGEEITLQHLGKRRRARITAPCAFDPKGDRLNA